LNSKKLRVQRELLLPPVRLLLLSRRPLLLLRFRLQLLLRQTQRLLLHFPLLHRCFPQLLLRLLLLQRRKSVAMSTNFRRKSVAMAAAAISISISISLLLLPLLLLLRIEFGEEGEFRPRGLFAPRFRLLHLFSLSL
jgi:hypothetical protein